MTALAVENPLADRDRSSVIAYEGDKSLTIGEWDVLGNRLAASFANLGISANDKVAVRVHVRLEWLIVSLALAKLGAILVAINYRLTASESRRIIQDCNVRAIVLDDEDPRPFVEAFKDLNLLAAVSIDGSWPGIANYRSLVDAGSPVPRPGLDFANTIIYTSGTTGAPKGILRDMASLTAKNPKVMQEYVASSRTGTAGGPGSVMLANLPLHHSMGPHALRGAIMSGGSVVLMRRFDAKQVLELIERHRVTDMGGVPTMHRQILSLPPEIRDRYDLSSLKHVTTGGAPVGAELKQQITDFLGKELLHEGYGISESGLITSCSPEDQRKKPGSCGKALKHVKIRIIDDNGSDLPLGEQGEILVWTPMIISGYVGRGPLGPDKLDPNGFYRTGDVGYLDNDGYLYVTDRKLDMIIAGGANVYPAEIEAVLVQHPSVAIAAVIGVPHASLGEQPEAYIELAPGTAATESEIIEFCEGRLAKFKWPRRIHIIDRIPINTDGKLLKRELRAIWKAEQATAGADA